MNVTTFNAHQRRRFQRAHGCSARLLIQKCYLTEQLPGTQNSNTPAVRQGENLDTPGLDDISRIPWLTNAKHYFGRCKPLTGQGFVHGIIHALAGFMANNNNTVF
jgi:hypothetical protein